MLSTDWELVEQKLLNVIQENVMHLDDAMKLEEKIKEIIYEAKHL